MLIFLCNLIDLAFFLLGNYFLCVSYYNNYIVYRELEARLEKQRATREYVQEFLKKKEEVLYVL